MNYAARTALAFLVVLATGLGAQQSQVPPAAPKDVKSADAILAAMYEANSVMVDQKRGADRFRSLYAPNARLISTTHGLASAVMNTRSVDEYVAAALSGRPRGGFSEREIARTSEAFGNIMQVWSRGGVALL